MNLKLRKITIVAEKFLKDPIVKLIREEGASGYTLHAVEGEGSRGINASDWEGRNAQIETIVSAKVAESILERLGEEYLENYAVIAYISEVTVLRRGKFANEEDA